MNGLFAPHLAAGNLNGTIGDHFVAIHVGLRAAARLPDAQRKVFIEFSFDDFLSSLFDKLLFLGWEFPELIIDRRRRFFE